MSEPFKITYVGGGSRFVVTLLHGLVAQSEALLSLGRSVELALLDPDKGRAGDTARYAEITSNQTGLPVATEVTDDQQAALEGAGLVIFSAGLWGRIMPVRKRLLDQIGVGHGESGPSVAVEAAALWPFLRRLGEDMRRLAPRATFATLVNPTDVQAAAFEKAFGIPSVGMCVEVPALAGWLSYYLEVPHREIELKHIGANHVGWTSEWTVSGRDGRPLFEERIPERMKGDDWYPHPTFLVRIYRATGYLRASAYHHWPFQTEWEEEFYRQSDAFFATCLAGWKGKREYREAMFRKALEEGRMIEEPEDTKVHPEAMAYTYPHTRHTLGALVVGLAGGSGGPVPLQVRNGASNPHLPPDAWLEVPTRVEKGKLLPQTVPPLPDWLFRDTETVLDQRRMLADWLAGRDERGLVKGLLTRPGEAQLRDLLKLAEELPRF